MRPKLFLHIGHNKVASSTLQLALRANADQIRSNGILIADETFDFPVEGPVQGHPLYEIEDIITASDESRARSEIEALEGRLLAALDYDKFSAAVISSENLTSGSASRLFGNLTDRFELKVLYLVRRQDEYLVSAWKQWGVRKGQTLNQYIDERLQNNSPEFLNIASNWESEGAEVRVIPLHTIKDIPALTFEWLGIRDAEPVQVPRTNETYDYSVLDVLARNPFLFSGTFDNSMFAVLDALLPKELPKASVRQLEEEYRERILDHFQEENALLQKQFTPESLPLDQYAARAEGGQVSDPDPLQSIYRYLGINLLMIKSLHERTSRVPLPADPDPTVQGLVEENKELRSSIESLTYQSNILEKRLISRYRFLRKLFVLLAFLLVLLGSGFLYHLLQTA